MWDDKAFLFSGFVDYSRSGRRPRSERHSDSQRAGRGLSACVQGLNGCSGASAVATPAYPRTTSRDHPLGARRGSSSSSHAATSTDPTATTRHFAFATTTSGRPLPGQPEPVA